MIIQCRVCRTKYRFEEMLLGSEGAWVRCIRCQNVFFQHPPLSAASPAEDKKTATNGSIINSPVPELGIGVKTASAIPVAGDKPAGEISLRTGETPGENGGAPALLPDISAEAPPPGVASPPAKGKAMRIWALGIIMLVLIAIGGALFVFPEYGQLAMGELHALFPGLAPPAATTTDTAPAAIGPAQVKIVDVRQRFVSNSLLGNMRIVEGLAMNNSPYPMTRIKIRGELVDLVGVMVKESSAFCGNLLTDEELGIMSEEQIFRELAIPQGSDVPNDRITPQGTIPFMLVFIREPAGVAKTLVIPTAAERLLSP